MRETTIHFIRHGEVDNPGHLLYERLPGFHLSDRGVRMAKMTAGYIAADPVMSRITAVYSSPLDRAVETARAVADALNAVRDARGQGQLQVSCDERLIEAGNRFRGTRVGVGEGALWRRGNWRLLLHPLRPSWGESYRHIASRMMAFAADITRRHPGEQVAVVSHESPIWTLRRVVETGRAEHWPWLRGTALASVTSITFACDSGSALAVGYVEPAARLRRMG